MKGTRAALRYAKATLNLAKERGVAENVYNDMLLIDQTIEENKELENLIVSPIVKSSVKSKILKAVFEKKTDSLTMDVIQLLINNNRINILELVAKEFVIIYDFMKGSEVALVTTAFPITKELEAKILKKVKTITGTDISIENKIDPDVLGGFILRVGDKQYDSSVKGILNNLLDKFEENQYVPKF
jgi:F-type H+-transporting ATPase subunit delta